MYKRQVVASFSSIASLSAPPLLGLLAQQIGVRHALLLICLAMIASVSVARSVRPVEMARRGGAPEPVPEREHSGLLVELATECSVIAGDSTVRV